MSAIGLSLVTFSVSSHSQSFAPPCPGAFPPSFSFFFISQSTVSSPETNHLLSASILPFDLIFIHHFFSAASSLLLPLTPPACFADAASCIVLPRSLLTTFLFCISRFGAPPPFQKSTFTSESLFLALFDLVLVQDFPYIPSAKFFQHWSISLWLRPLHFLISSVSSSTAIFGFSFICSIDHPGTFFLLFGAFHPFTL